MTTELETMTMNTPSSDEGGGSLQSDSGNDSRGATQLLTPLHPSHAKRSWSEHEDVILIEVLVELHNTGRYHADRGFKLSLYAAVEKELHRCLPGCGIRADPHIYSRMKTFKNHYNIVHDMVFHIGSGFGWDLVNKCVTAYEAVWSTYIQTHKAAAQFRGRQFKYFDELALIFRSDRANGRGAANHATAAAQSLFEPELPIDVSSDDTPDMTHGDSSGERSSQGTPVGVKKRKVSRDGALFTAMKENTTMIVSSIDRLTDKLCAAITSSELHDKRVELTYQLREISSLITQMQDDTHMIIGCDKDLLDVFSTVREEDRESWVLRVLNRYG